jgi:hypothetical protein
MHYLINLILTNDETKNIFDFKYIFLGKTINNRILENGNFTRIYYSTPLCSFNGIYLLLQIKGLNETNINNTPNCKMKLCIKTNIQIIKNIQQIEETILSVIDIQTKKPIYKIYNDLINGFIKLNYKYDYKQIVLKISGIWETEFSYGLTYKYYHINDTS